MRELAMTCSLVLLIVSGAALLDEPVGTASYWIAAVIAAVTFAGLTRARL